MARDPRAGGPRDKRPGSGHPPSPGRAPESKTSVGHGSGGTHRSGRREPLPAGLPARQAAAAAVSGVLLRGRALDDSFSTALGPGETERLEPRDRAFARLLASTVLRRSGELQTVVASFLDKPLSEKHREVGVVMLIGAAQLLFLGTPPHAAISLAVEQCRRTPGGLHLDKLVNAVLRRVATDGPQRLSGLDAARVNVPDWMWSRWAKAYGEDVARKIAVASQSEAALDISVKDDVSGWAERLGGVALSTGTIRVASGGRVEDLPGFADGAWWVQDVAAAIPARLLGDVAGQRVADLCAAPGGKTARLAASGAIVTAVDLSSLRLARVTENMKRLGLEAEIVAADILTWQPERPFDAVLLDAPCTATGTIRRHPDIPHLKRDFDVAALAEVQAKLLARAVSFVRPGGVLAYCTCSLEPEEGVEQVERLLAAYPDLSREPISATEFGGSPEWITAAGDLRTLPFHDAGLSPNQPADAGGGTAGMDGFYAARLRKSG